MYTNTGLAKPMVIAEAAILMMFKLSLQLRAIEEVASAAKIAAEFFSESNHELSGALTELARAIDSSTDSLTKSDQKKNLQSRLRVEPILSWLNSY